MLTKYRFNKIFYLAMPIIGGMASQNILNLVDTAMVGRLGDSALAAVGIGSFANFMAMSFITGLASGVQAMAARRKGEGRESEMAVPLTGGLLLALILAIPLTIILFIFIPDIFPLLNKDPNVIPLGTAYLRARIIALIAVGMNFAFRGYWNGINLSKLYFRTLIFMHACNIFLNYILIFGHWGFPRLGVLGAGLGTSIATFLGTAYYFYLGFTRSRQNGFFQRVPSIDTLKTMLKISVPSGIQTLFFASGMTALFWIIGQVGTKELAASNVLIQVMLVAILPGIGLGLAAASLVGQSLGKKSPLDAKQWGWDTVKVGILLMGILGLPMLLLPTPILSLFMKDPKTIQLAIFPLQIIGAAIAIDGIGMVLLNALLGAGDSRTVMFVSISLQWFLFLPVAWYIGPVMGMGLSGIWIAQVIYRGLQALVFAGVWHRGKWIEIKV